MKKTKNMIIKGRMSIEYEPDCLSINNITKGD